MGFQPVALLPCSRSLHCASMTATDRDGGRESESEFKMRVPWFNPLPSSLLALKTNAFSFPPPLQLTFPLSLSSIVAWKNRKNQDAETVCHLVPSQVMFYNNKCSIKP